MTTPDKNLWKGLAPEAQSGLVMRDYNNQTLAQQLAKNGVEAAKLVSADRGNAEIREAWIPGVEVFARTVYPQRHRGVFGEFARRDEGLLARIAFWPTQWATARMFVQTAKGFHIHPPHVPVESRPADWFRRCFINEAENFSLRRYDLEQWDVLFFVQGMAELILRDARDGMPVRTMHFFVDGDNHRSASNVGIVVPPGVAHAVRVEGSEDLIMVYGTSKSFKPEFEGRIASEVETAELPESWRKFLG